MARAGGKLRFKGVGTRDVYNITAPFLHGTERIIAGRVEARDVEHSDVMFFHEGSDGVWAPHPDAPILRGLQDPCITRIAGEWVVGGVRFPAHLQNGAVGWRMEFFRGKSPFRLRAFLIGPDQMKDIRLVELLDGRVGVFTRPQGRVGGRGKIGFYVADQLEAITPETIATAPLLEPQCAESEWVGANEAHPLPDGTVGVLGHIACFDRIEHRHYFPMIFRLDPMTAKTSPVRIVARRGDFPPGAAKRPDLAEVVFSGGLSRGPDGMATLYAGLGDSEAGWLELPDPFV